MASFLSDAKARLQHNNKVSLAPKDIRNLAEMISSEKSVINSSSRLSVDLRKSSEAMKEWGLGEGDDLADILPKLSILFGHLADAQSRFSDHDSTYRLHFKSVRMREENLASLKKSKDALQAKIVALDKKLTKMSIENKDLPALSTRLQEYRSELISLEHSVSTEEARLSDFKRETVREGFGLRLGAMLELAEKMVIISEMGKMIVAEVPVSRTLPGGTRAPYYSSNRTQSILEEAQKCLTEVIFNPSPSAVIVGLGIDNDTASISPNSDRLPPSHQSLQSRRLSPSAELPPLYFSANGDLRDSTHASQSTPTSGNLTPGANPKPSRQESNCSLPYAVDASETHSAMEPATPTTAYSSSVYSQRFPPVPQQPGMLGYQPSSQSFSSPLSPASPSLHSPPKTKSDEEFYVRGPDGVPKSTRVANPTEYQSSKHEPTHEAQDEPNQSYLKQPPSHENDRLQTSKSEDPLVTSTLNKPYRSMGNRYASSASTNGTPINDGRMTNAGAFRKAPANHQSTTNSPGNLNRADNGHSSNPAIAPLNIHKRQGNQEYPDQSYPTDYQSEHSTRSPPPRSFERSFQHPSPHILPPSSSSTTSGPGFGQNRYVTNLD